MELWHIALHVGIGVLSCAVFCACWRRAPWKVPRERCDVLVVGSSVANGTGARRGGGTGWAFLMGAELERRYGLRVHNAAVGGYNTARASSMLQRALPVAQARVVVIGLSLGNERLARTRNAEAAEELTEAYLAGIREMAAEARVAGARVVIGGVYPNSMYKPHHLPSLRRADAALRESGLDVLSFLPALDAGDGRWKPEAKADWAHPNARGHRLMYTEGVEPRLEELFGSLVPPKARGGEGAHASGGGLGTRLLDGANPGALSGGE